MVPSIKGQSVIVAKKYLIQRFGEQFIDKISAQMDKADRDVVTGDILPGSWIPEQVFVNFLVAAEKNRPEEVKNISFDVGYESALRSVSKMYKIFIRIGDPSFVLSKVDTFWHQIHNHGRFEIVEKAAKSVAGCIYGYMTPNKVFCNYLKGYFKGVLEMSGVKNVMVSESECVNNGGLCCKFTGSWD